MDREKVIEEMSLLRDFLIGEQRKAFKGNNDSSVMALMHYRNIVIDAISLLKEKEHSETFIVIDNKTGEEADPYEIALHEDWAKHLCYCDIDGWAIEDDGTLLLVDECGRVAYADKERFKVKWDEINRGDHD